MEFNFSAKITITTYTTVEAGTVEEAIEIAKERMDMMSVHSNNGDSPEEVWMIDELDGTPYDINLER